MSSLTIVIPALNEEGEIAATVRGLTSVARETVSRFEVIMIDDGSTDKTGKIMDQLAQEIPEGRVVHNEKPLGVGKAFSIGLALSKCDYITICPGDNAYSMVMLPEVFRRVGQADFILTYRTNQFHARKFSRFIISKLFNFILIGFFGISARDLHSLNVYSVPISRKIKPIENIGFQIDLVINFLRGKVKTIELPVSLNSLEYKNKSTSLKLVRFIEIFHALVKIKTHRPDLK